MQNKKNEERRKKKILLVDSFDSTIRRGFFDRMALAIPREKKRVDYSLRLFMLHCMAAEEQSENLFNLFDDDDDDGGDDVR